jgi:hypothetical protein
VLPPDSSSSSSSWRWVQSMRSSSLCSFLRPTVTSSLFFLNGIVAGGVQLGPLGTAATSRPIVPAPGDYDDGEIGGMIGKGTEVLGETCPNAALSTTNPTCCPDANPDRRVGKPATNRLSYGTAYIFPLSSIYFRRYLVRYTCKQSVTNRGACCRPTLMQ